PRLNNLAIDRWVLGFTLLVSILTGIVFGLAPALQSSKPDLNAALKEGRPGGSRFSQHRLRGLLVVVEVALALVLLIGAGLLIKSFKQLSDTRLGFEPDRVLTASVTLPEASFPRMAQIKNYYRETLERLAGRPEIQAVGIVNALPLGK